MNEKGESGPKKIRFGWFPTRRHNFSKIVGGCGSDLIQHDRGKDEAVNCGEPVEDGQPEKPFRE